LGKNEGIKKWMALKTEGEAALDLLPIWAIKNEWDRARERKKVHWKLLTWAKETETTRAHIPDPHGSTRYGPRSARMTKHGLVLSHVVPFYQPHTTRPHTTRPHSSAWNSQLNGIPPVRAPCEGFRQGLGENWGKTKELGKTEYN
jgi:hypothetical protein